MAKHLGMEDFFDLLDKWRHFPAFPLEPRSETLFALFLPMVLRDSKSVGVKVKPQVIPQFPLKHDCNNQSDKVDFFALSEDGRRGFLIELKTDMDSRRETQDNYLTRAVEKDMDEILSDLKKIVQSSTEKRKYFYLLNTLSELGLIKLQDDLKDMIYPSNVRGVNGRIGEIKIPKSSKFVPEVVYVQPYQSEEDKPDDKRFHYIYFKEFAKIIENQGDVGKMFADYLRKWIEDPANQPPSEDLNR